MTFRNAVRVVVAAVCVLAATLTGGASTFNRMTYFTFNAPVRVHGVLLPPGDYVFEIANPSQSHDVVRVLNRETHQSVYVGFTRSVERPLTMSSEQAVTFNEAAAGTPMPLRAWYPIGFNEGHEFIYK